MKHIEYIIEIAAMAKSKGHPLPQWLKFDTSPWTAMEKPLAETRLALLSSAGISGENHEPFDSRAVNDLSFREISTDTSYKKLTLHNDFFDHRDALQDLNCVLPVKRLHDLEKSGFIGGLCRYAFTLGMGRLDKTEELQKETVPKIVKKLKAYRAGAVLLVAV